MPDLLELFEGKPVMLCPVHKCIFPGDICPACTEAKKLSQSSEMSSACVLTEKHNIVFGLDYQPVQPCSVSLLIHNHEIYDNGLELLLLRDSNKVVGSINYGTGDCTITDFIVASYAYSSGKN